MYLATVRTAAVDGGRQCDDSVTVDVVPSTSTKTGVVPGTLRLTRPVRTTAKTIDCSSDIPFLYG